MEVKPKRTEYRSQQIIQYDLDGKEVGWYPTLAMAAKAAKVSKAAMSIYLTGKRKSPVCAGFIWKYAPIGDPEQICKPVEEEKPKKELPVDPTSDSYKWDSWKEVIQRRIKRENETRKRNQGKDY